MRVGGKYLVRLKMGLVKLGCIGEFLMTENPEGIPIKSGAP